MKRNILVLAGAMVVMSMAANAHALSLSVSNDGLVWQTVADNGVGDTDLNIGSISFTSTTLSGFTKVKVGSASEASLKSGSLYTNSFEASGAPANFYVMLSDYPYNLNLPANGGSSLTGLTIQNAGATADLKTYYGTSLFDTTHLIADVSLTSPGYTGQNTNLPALAIPFSLTEFLTIHNTGSDVSSQVTASLDVTPVPEPGTMVLLGAGLFCLAIGGKRHLKNKEYSGMSATA